MTVDYVSLLCLNKVSYCFKKSDVKAWNPLYNMEFGACFLQLLTNRADFAFDANNSVFKQGVICVFHQLINYLFGTTNAHVVGQVKNFYFASHFF